MQGSCHIFIIPDFQPVNLIEIQIPSGKFWLLWKLRYSSHSIWLQKCLKINKCLTSAKSDIQNEPHSADVVPYYKHDVVKWSNFYSSTDVNKMCTEQSLP